MTSETNILSRVADFMDSMLFPRSYGRKEVDRVFDRPNLGVVESLTHSFVKLSNYLYLRYVW